MEESRIMSAKKHRTINSKIMHLEEGDPSGEVTSGVIAQALHPFYIIIFESTKKWVKYSHTFWGLFSILVMLLFIKLHWVTLDYLMAFLGIAFILEIISLNKGFFRRISGVKSEKVVRDFFKNINYKTTSEVKEFIEANSLNTQTIINLLKNIKYKNISFYKAIFDNQNIDADLISYIVSERKLEKMSPSLLANAVLNCESTIDNTSYNYLIKSKIPILRGAAVMKNYRQVSCKSFLDRILYLFFRISSLVEQFINTSLGKFCASTLVFFLILTSSVTPIWASINTITDAASRVIILVYFLMAVFALSAVIVFVLLKIHKLLAIRFWSVYGKRQ